MHSSSEPTLVSPVKVIHADLAIHARKIKVCVRINATWHDIFAVCIYHDSTLWSLHATRMLLVLEIWLALASLAKVCVAEQAGKNSSRALEYSGCNVTLWLA